jgi:hypothetical protein
MAIENGPGAADAAVESAQGWAENFAAAPLTPPDAADLVAGALKATLAVSQAAVRLSWLTQDTFVEAMRRMEQNNGQ